MIGSIIQLKIDAKLAIRIDARQERDYESIKYMEI
jgi:hypothetical protein